MIDFSGQICKSSLGYMNSLELLLFCSIHHSRVWDNLRVLLDRIFVPSAPRTLIT